MKCRIKSSGEIVDVINWSIDGAYTDYIDKDGIEVSSLLNYYKNFEPIVEDNIDWEQRMYELAKAAITGLYAREDEGDICKMRVSVSKDLLLVVDELIKQLKAIQNEI